MLPSDTVIFPHQRVLAEIGKRHGRTPRQVTLNFLIHHPNIFTIPKTSLPERARENSGDVGWELTGEEISAIDLAFRLPDHDVLLEMI